MALQQVRSANFGKGKANLTGSSGVGYTLLDTAGTVAQARTTTGVYQLLSGSGLYAANISFLDQFNGSILWDSGEAPTLLAYATEQYNTEENDPKVGSIYTDVQFIKSIEGGRWKINTATNQMIFYASDNTTVVATFNLYDQAGAPTSTAPYERTRV